MAPDSFKSNYNLPHAGDAQHISWENSASPRAPSKESHRRVLEKESTEKPENYVELTKPTCKGHAPGQAKDQTSSRIGQQCP